MQHPETSSETIVLVAMRLKDYAQATMEDGNFFMADERMLPALTHADEWLVFTGAKDRYVAADTAINANEDHQFQLLSALGAPCHDEPNHSHINDAQHYGAYITGWPQPQLPLKDTASVIRAEDENGLRALFAHADVQVVTSVNALNAAMHGLHKKRVIDAHVPPSDPASNRSR